MRCLWPLPPNPQTNRIETKFLDPNYPRWRIAMGLPADEHTGIDINLAGTSGNNDLRYPVVAVLSGIVKHARAHRVWGNIVLIEHPPHIASLYNLPYLATQYAHLNDIVVREGQVVFAGEPVGTVGRGDPTRPFLAHLHFEMRVKPLPADNWPGADRKAIEDGYIDPARFLTQHSQYDHRYLYPSARLLNDPSQKGFVFNLEDLYTAFVRGKLV